MPFISQLASDQQQAYKNISATGPTVNDDNTLGYYVGDKWLCTASQRRVFECLKTATGAAVWFDITQVSGGAGATPADELLFGTLLDYPLSAGVAAGEIQYIRLPVVGGAVFRGMRTFLDSGGSATRNIRFGLYDQTDPADPTLAPNARLVETPQMVTTGDGFLSEDFIGGDYTIPTTGFYWLAIVGDSTVPKYSVSSSFRADFLPVRREDPGNTADLPATTGTLTNPVSAVIYVSLVIA